MVYDFKDRIDRLIAKAIEHGPSLAPPVTADGVEPITASFCFGPPLEVDSRDAVQFACPEDLRYFWNSCTTARLFEDRVYGQWGLEILPPHKVVNLNDEGKRGYAICETREYFEIGQFLGDSDLLTVWFPERDKSANIVVASPALLLYEWEVVAESFVEFLERYFESKGQKYWEPS